MSLCRAYEELCNGGIRLKITWAHTSNNLTQRDNQTLFVFFFTRGPQELFKHVRAKENWIKSEPLDLTIYKKHRGQKNMSDNTTEVQLVKSEKQEVSAGKTA